MDTKFILLICLLAVMFVAGLKCGEHHVINHQKIEKTDIGYQVDFDGNYYEYYD